MTERIDEHVIIGHELGQTLNVAPIDPANKGPNDLFGCIAMRPVAMRSALGQHSFLNPPNDSALTRSANTRDHVRAVGSGALFGGFIFLPVS